MKELFAGFVVRIIGVTFVIAFLHTFVLIRFLINVFVLSFGVLSLGLLLFIHFLTLPLFVSFARIFTRIFVQI